MNGVYLGRFATPFLLHSCFQRRIHLLIEQEQMLDTPVLQGKAAGWIHPVYRPVKGVMGFAQVGLYQVRLVQVG